MGQSTEISPLVSMLFRTDLNPLKFLMKLFNILLIKLDIGSHRYIIYIIYIYIYNKNII